MHLLGAIPQIGINVSGCGKIGVWIFFVLSALLLTIQWLSKETITKKDIVEFLSKEFLESFHAILWYYS